MPLPERCGRWETTEITEKIMDFHEGRGSEADLIQYLAYDARYASGEDPNAPKTGSPEWWLYHRDGGRPYVPGSWDEVRLNVNLGLLPRDIVAKVNHITEARSVKRT